MVSLVSDLHLDLLHPERMKKIVNLIAEHGTGQCLILAGDIASAHTGKGQDAWNYLTEEIKGKYSSLVAVLGNHEHYGGNFEDTGKLIPSAINLLDRGVVETPLFNIYGCTLWSSIPKHVESVVADSFNDYCQIKMEGACYSVSDHNKLYEKDRAWLADQLFFHKQIEDKPAIVVTHHAPLLNKGCSAPEYMFKQTNYFFESKQDDLIKETTPQIWCFGHTHHRNDFMFEKTRIVTNSLGYRNELRNPYQVVDLL